MPYLLDTGRTMTCADAAGIVRADIARWCNAPQDPDTVAAAYAVAESHYYGFGNCADCLAGNGLRSTRSASQVGND